MLRIEIDVMDLFSARLRQFGAKAPKIALRICRTIGQGYRKYVKKNYLRGQVLGKRSGELYKSIKIVTDKRNKNAVVVKPWARLANIYHSPDGATITPTTKRALRFVTQDGTEVFTKRVHLRPRPWVPRSKREFPWDVEIKKSADKVIEREIAKLEAKSGTG